GGRWEYWRVMEVGQNQAGGWTGQTSGLPDGGRMHRPADWGQTLGVDFRGRVRYTRHFNCPTGLEPRDRVWLVLEGVDARGEVVLNSARLGPVSGFLSPARFDVTSILQPRNELAVDVELPPLPATEERHLRRSR